MTGTLAMLIPILALSIPIVAIIAGTYAKTHSGGRPNPDLEKRIFQLENIVEELQDTNRHLDNSVKQLEDKQNFLTRLIEDKT